MRAHMELFSETRGSGEPVIVLHGLFGSLENWQSINAKLAERFLVIAMDQRNHGRSPHDRRMDYVEMAGDVRESLRARSISRARVIGHSMGGKTAMQLALESPGIVEQLVVVDVAPKQYFPRHSDILEALLSLNLHLFESRKEVEDALAPLIPDLSVRRFLLKNLKHDEGGGFSWKMGLREIVANYDRLGASVSGPVPCAVPALFITGALSDYVSEEDKGLILRMFPAAKIVSIKGAGHWLHAEQPAQVLGAILDFFGSEKLVR